MANPSAQAFPAKRFFVDMLTRDIELQDAILDLLDNCVDGAMRMNQSRSVDPVHPYQGYHARINFDGTSFSVEDNCGGIPRDLAIRSAFRMGRPDEHRDPNLPTVGVYGIGMKRAIFKMGRAAFIRSETANDKPFKVVIDGTWLDNDNAWDLPIVDALPATQTFGTLICVSELREGIARLLSNDTDFETDLRKSIAAYYSYIIEKGFTVTLNGVEIPSLQVSLLFDRASFENGQGIVPYVYQNERDGVSVSLAVGIYRDLPSEEEEEDALTGRVRTERAGWTIICNDRVVVYADKSRLTGWGEAGVPSYHTQFVSIAGVVVLKSNDPSRLPITTTKRGVDGNSELYLTIKEYMREGLKLFTDFTNKWKRSSSESSALKGKATTTNADSISALVPKNSWSNVRAGGQRFKPNLPAPKDRDPIKQIRFSKRMSEIQAVAGYIFDDPDTPIAKVGEQCFDDVYAKVTK